MQNHESASTLKGRDPEAGRYWTPDGMPSSLPRRASELGMQPKGMPATSGLSLAICLPRKGAPAGPE